jgi:hypothetical protein
MTRGELEKLPCVKYGMEVLKQPFEKATSHIEEVDNEQRAEMKGEENQC